MIGHQDLDRLIGATAYGQDGEKIGDVDTVYVDDQTNEPKFALVNTGLFGMRSSFVPLRDARMDGDDLRVAYSKDTVKDAPKMDPDGRLEPDEERELFRYYDLADADTGMRADTTGTETTGRSTTGTDTDDAMTRSEEQVHVGKERHEAGRARLRKYVTTENVTKTVPVQREEVRVEREPITDENRDAATSGPAISEDEHEVVLEEEEPVVEKRTVPKERVRLDKDTETEEREVSEEVAREEIDVAGLEESRERRR